MRDIEFRGRHIITNQWVHGYGLLKERLPESIAEQFQRTKAVYIFNGRHVEVKPETVGQYTGRSDIRNRKIFEGMTIEYLTEGRKTEGKVIYSEGSFIIEQSPNGIHLLEDFKKNDMTIKEEK